MLSEYALYHLSKQPKNKRRCHQSLETEGMQETQDQMQCGNAETESEQSEKAPQSPIIILGDSVNSPSSGFNGVDLQGPHPIFLIP